MEYKINFNDDNDANTTVLAALEDLNNTFFAEYSNSEDENDEKEPSFIPDNDDNKVILDNNDNSHLNDFEFKENSDSYIEDKIYNDIKLKVKEFFLKKKCSYRNSDQPCFTKIGYERFLACQAEFEGLDKQIKDMVIKGQFMAFQKDDNTRKANSDNRKFVCFSYCYNSNLPICRTTYKNLIETSHKYLDAIIHYL
ncbi:hypothetical protein RclHR1_06880001 [Rhizophagus clarus]|uniref:Uncharacterized protein n=1 Tax=Rhizophagus clarus TaxID=94130 RepID=A0A2Z6RUT1_9GLOM|nr:hypothetical protein RclHR1_06880001 [Rhizophagus clarus]GES99656.1 hypothetical protein GLOIN_2v1838883 [Rhizophagus clarus]